MSWTRSPDGNVTKGAFLRGFDGAAFAYGASSGSAAAAHTDAVSVKQDLLVACACDV